MSLVDVIEGLCADYLAGSVEEWREEAHKDVAARQAKPEATVVPARGDDDAPRDTAPRPPSARSDDEAPPQTAVAVRKAICPTVPVELATADQDPGWQNPRLRFSGEARSTTPAQKAEILRRDGYCCANPGCPNKLWLDVHHVVFYYLGGVTLPENLVVVCTACHRNLHRGRLRVSGTAPHGLVWTDRAGGRLERALTLA